MIDMHTHLDLYPDALSILDKTNKDNIFTLAVTTSPRAWSATSKVFKNYCNIHVALGLHPEILESKINEIELLIQSIKHTIFIGEVGIDGSQQFSNSLDLQIDVFDRVLNECTIEGGKIISIHSRGASTRVLNILDKYPKCGIPILHWFNGTKKDLEYAIALGCWFSINPIMCKTKKGLSLIEKMPRTKLLPESDGPFTAVSNKSIYPWEAINVISAVASLWDCTENEVIMQFKTNLCNLLESREISFE